jgi:virulence-associated protein VapD
LAKYVWAYYWAVNIMLTVGFGDLCATTYLEALCLIFIEIISVMCLAYNISWIGTLISNIRAQDLEKGRNFKTFRQLSDKYALSSELEWRISNYIEESVNIRKKFNIEEERHFISSLPATMKKDYLKESNKSIFQELPFFGTLVERTLHKFAEKIEMTISHPEQLLRKIDDDYNLLILREGEIGYSVKRRNCDFNGMVIDKVKVRP